MKWMAVLLSFVLLTGQLDAQKSGSSSRPASSGSRSYSAGSNKPSTSSKPPASSGSKSYSSGKPSTNTSKPPATTHSTSTSKPPTIRPDAANRAQQTVESRERFKTAVKKGDAPKTEYKTAGGTTVHIDPKDKKIERLRNQLDHQKYVNRELRTQNFYANYYSRPPLFPPLYHFHDPYNPFFFLWLMDGTLDDRAFWCYHHRYDMDDIRYQELLRKDSQLEKRIRELEAQKLQRDNTYVVSGVDPDLVYTDEYVEAVYNPEHPVVQTNVKSEGGSSWWWEAVLVILVLGMIGLAVWFVFIRELK